VAACQGSAAFDRLVHSRSVMAGPNHARRAGDIRSPETTKPSRHHGWPAGSAIKGTAPASAIYAIN